MDEPQHVERQQVEPPQVERRLDYETRRLVDQVVAEAARKQAVAETRAQLQEDRAATQAHTRRVVQPACGHRPH
ncbi:MAG TPA: hypothetical protein VGM78_13440 [Ilumatobacteraceae bacterium]